MFRSIPVLKLLTPMVKCCERDLGRMVHLIEHESVISPPLFWQLQRTMSGLIRIFPSLLSNIISCYRSTFEFQIIIASQNYRLLLALKTCGIVHDLGFTLVTNYTASSNTTAASKLHGCTQTQILKYCIFSPTTPL